MGNSSPTTLIFTGMVVAAMSFKLQKDYLYFSYAAIVIGLIMFIIGIVKFIKQRNMY